MTTTTTARETSEKRELRTGVILAIVLVSYFMIILDNSIVFTGLPQIQADLGLSTAGLAWAQNAYTLVFGGLLLLGARTGDILGRRQVFVTGLVLFSLASFLVGTAQSKAWMIAARAFQGVGAAIVAPSSLALITAVMIVLALTHLPLFEPVKGRFDLLGAFASTLGMGTLVYGVYGVINAGERNWGDPLTVWPIAIGAVLLLVFVVNEWHARQPIMPLRLFASAQRSGAAMARLLFAGTMIAFFFYTTQFFQGVYGWTPLEAGLGFLPMTLVQFGSSLLVPRLTRRVGTATLVVAGLVLVLAGMAWISQITASIPFVLGAVGPLVLLGLGQGLAFGPLTSAGVTGARAEEAGAASGLVNTAHQLGSTLGVAVLTAAAAGAATLEQRVVDAYVGGTVMLGPSS